MDEVSKYSFNGSEALAESREDYQFYECLEDTDGNKEYIPIDVADVRVVKVETEQDNTSKKSLSYYLTVQCFSEVSGEYTLRYSIARKQYLSFVNEKKVGDFRLKMLQKYSKGDLFVRKVEGRTHIDIRMTTALHKQICADAEACKMTPSAYLRDLAKGKRPRKALTEEEFSIMQDFVAVYRNYENFFNATKGVMNGMTPQQKLEYIIEGNAYRWWRKFLIEGLPIMKRMIDGQRMYSNSVWKDAQGKQLPKYDREVIALVPHGTDEYKVVFAHRPNPKGWDGKSIIDGTIQHHTPVTYGIGKWNQPDVAYWLDVAIPKLNKKED